MFFSQEKDTVKRIAYAPSFGRKCEFPLGPKNAVFLRYRDLTELQQQTGIRWKS